MKKFYLLVVAFTCLVNITSAQVDTVYHLDPSLVKKYLKPSSSQYLVFIQLKNSPERTFTSVWSREVRYVTKQNQDLIEIKQKWYGSDTTHNRYVYTLCHAKNLAPIHHYTKSTRGVEAYDFMTNKIVGSDSVINNSKKGFEITSVSPLLNWEIDMETFPLLDLKAGKRFAINYYHPGGRTEPQLYEYKVTGEEIIQTIVGAKVACWKLRIDYSETTFATFYISKKNHEVLKMEEDFGTGIRYKVKLSNTVAIN